MERDILKRELEELISSGETLIKFAEAQLADKKPLSQIVPVGNFQSWYSRALRVIRSIAPERLADFEIQYTGPKRSSIAGSNYCIADYYNGRSYATGAAKSSLDYKFYLLFAHQVHILASCLDVFESAIANIDTLAKADLFDSELKGAKELLRNNYVRAAGVIAGVVLERHLSDLCAKHGVRLQKKDPGINDYGTALQSAGIIDTVRWRRLQSLADVRNLCGHKKTREPSTEEVAEMIDGVDATVKTLF